ncbi:MAG: bifunctional diguanylate cyclase/phosphodiesterase [Methylophilus sp.]
MLTDWLDALLNILTQFTGTEEEISPIVVNYVMATIFYLFLFVFARIRYQIYGHKHEQLLMWGFGLGLFTEVLNFSIALVHTLGLVSTISIYSRTLPITHTFHSISLVIIAIGFIKNYFNDEKLWLNALKASLISTLLISVITIWQVLNNSATPQISHFDQVDFGWLFHLNASIWVSLAIFALFKKLTFKTPKAVLAALSMFLMSEILKLSDIATYSQYKDILIPIAELSYLLALTTFAYAYLKNSVNERIVHTSALEQSEAKLDTMIKTINDLIWLKDPNGVYLACNAAFERLYGAKEADIIGKTDYDFVDRELADFFREHDRIAAENGVSSMNEEWLTFADDGHLALVETTKTPMFSQSGNLIGVLGVAHDITRRKALETKNKQFELIVNSSLDAIISKKTDGRITSWNPGAEKMFGYTAEEIIGQSISKLYPLELLEQESFIQTKIINGQKVDSFDTIRINKSGEKIHLSISMSPIFDEKGEVTGISTIARNITDRIIAEQNFKRLSHLYQALSEINQAIVRMEHEEELFPLVCRCAVDFGGLSMAWVGQLDPNSDRINPVAMYGEHLDYLEGIFISTDASIPQGQGPGGISVRENRLIVCNDVENDSIVLAWRDRVIASGWNSICTSPINRGGKPFAVLCVYHSQVNAFDQAIIALLNEMSTDISFALDNFDREIQRKSAEESLRLAASVYTTSNEAMVVTKPNREVIDINPAFTVVTGYSKTEVLGKTTEILRSPERDESIYSTILEQINLHGKWHGETWARRKNGESFPVWMTTSSVYKDDGSLNYRVSLFTDISQKKASEELIWTQANLDPLTGLPNRYMFNDRLGQEIKKSDRSGLPLALLFLDLDRFKEVNDTLGHSVGDNLLKITAQRLKECARKSDTVARLGGDEFTIILSELDDISSVYRVIESILSSVAEPFNLEDEQAFISTSIGVTFYPGDAKNAEELIRNADQAMYAAKNAGRNRISFFTKNMQNVAEKRMRLVNELHHALAKNQIWVAYQPILELKTGRIAKAEALARWQHPTLGAIYPSEFIPIAEHTGLIIDIGNWIFKQALQQVKIWQENYDPDFQISVNKSPVQIHEKHEKADAWHLQIKEEKLAGRSIVAEITEGILLENNVFINEKLLEFRDAGIQVALDDFGTGYSSLSYLQKFDIDYIKIDQSFVRELETSQQSVALCEAIIVMAHKLGMQVVAEGIETEGQRQQLIDIGCDFGQGFLFSKPVTAEAFEALLTKEIGTELY